MSWSIDQLQTPHSQPRPKMWSDTVRIYWIFVIRYDMFAGFMKESSTHEIILFTSQDDRIQIASISECRAPIILSLLATVTTLSLNWSSVLARRERFSSILRMCWFLGTGMWWWIYENHINSGSKRWSPPPEPVYRTCSSRSCWRTHAENAKHVNLENTLFVNITWPTRF